MRRPPEVGKAGLIVLLLLGAAGCAGFPQRTNGNSPWSDPANGQPASPPGLFSWWHREQLANHLGRDLGSASSDGQAHGERCRRESAGRESLA